MTHLNDTSPMIRARRIKRIILIEERNDPPAPNTFDVKVTYDSDDLPEWFAPLQPIVEDETFTDLNINLGNGKTRYHLSIVQAHLPRAQYSNRHDDEVKEELARQRRNAREPDEW